jgi:hypothetical protein
VEMQGNALAPSGQTVDEPHAQPSCLRQRKASTSISTALAKTLREPYELTDADKEHAVRFLIRRV